MVQGIGDNGTGIPQHASNLFGIGQTCLMAVYKHQNIPLDGRRNTQTCHALLNLKIESFVGVQA